VSAGEEVDERADEDVRAKDELRGMESKVDDVGEEVYVWPSGDTVLPDEMSRVGPEGRRTIVWAHL
jgi:hypothetical protein